MTDSHDLLESWLIEGAVGDPPRELAVHAAVCDSCGRRLGAFDSLALVDVAAAGSPPPVASPSRLVATLLWARTGTAVVATVAAGVLVVVAATQLAGIVGGLPAPSDGVAFETGSGALSSDESGSRGPEPAGEPSVPGPTPTPIPTFIPLPTVAPGAAPLAAPSAPILVRGAVTQSSINMFWTNGSGGGPVQKWDVWRRIGTGTWQKLGELPAATHSMTNSGLASGTSYSYRIRAVNTSALGSFSNTITGTTLSPPAPTPTPVPTPSQPTPECSDSLDNDADGWTDFPNDPNCSSTSDSSEAPADPHECNDGIDNDADGYTDVGSDPSCSDAFDDSEAPADPHECNDGIDNDADGYTDVGSDPSCSDALDDTEAPADAHECNDGIDNDGDGYIDFGSDPSCSDAFDDSEAPMDPPPPTP